MLLQCPKCNSSNVIVTGISNIPRYRRAGNFIHRFDVSRFQCRACGERFEIERFVVATEISPMKHADELEDKAHE